MIFQLICSTLNLETALSMHTIKEKQHYIFNSKADFVMNLILKHLIKKYVIAFEHYSSHNKKDTPLISKDHKILIFFFFIAITNKAIPPTPNKVQKNTIEIFFMLNVLFIAINSLKYF